MDHTSTNSMSRRAFLAGTAAVAAGFGLTLYGCGGGGGNSGGGTASNTLTGAVAYQNTDFTPVGASSALVLGANWHVLEALYDMNMATYETYNALAADEPVAVSDTEYEIALREGAMFSDGNPVTAADVANAVNLNVANSLYVDMLGFINTAEAKDDTTVVLKLNYPFATLLKERLSIIKVFPASQDADSLKTGPIGSGPWMYQSVNGEDGGAIDFVPNPNYNGPYPAPCESMHWDVLLDGTARTTALSEATALIMESVPDANVEQLEGAGATVEYVPGFTLPFLMFNTKKAPFDDYRVRQAFFYAINTEKLISNQMAGHGAAATCLLPSYFPNYHEASTVYTYDPEKAKELLSEAGAEGLSFTLKVNNNWVQDLSAQIQQDLNDVGMTCELQVEAIQWNELAESDSELPYDVMLTPGDPTCFGNDPDLIMSWWYGDNIWTQGRSCWKSSDEWEELQDLMQQAREAEGSEQQELWNQCFDLLAEQVPLYPLFHREIATGYWADRISGFEPIGTTGINVIGAELNV